jgi:hypothetical protein
MMRTPSTTRGRTVAAALAAAVVVGGATGALVAQGQSNSTMPAAPPTDAKAAKLSFINKTVTPSPTKTKGFDGFQTYVVKAPSGRNILTGYATLSGGNTGSAIIKSTTVTPKQFTVQLEFPGEQGTNPKLNVRVLTLPNS